MNKKIIIGLALTCLFPLASCGETSSIVESYYVIDTSNIRSEMLVNTTIVLNPKFTDLGESVTPQYDVKISLDNNDVTEQTYNKQTKKFAPTQVGSYSVKFVVLNDEGDIYQTSEGTVFEKTINIDVVVQSFAPRDSAGNDVSVSNDGVITFGESYSTSGTKKTSNQYKVTGVTFSGSYSITYELSNIKNDPTYPDSSLYFGWVKDWKENNDDSIKLSTMNGSMAAWIWGKDGDLADLSVNKNQGWSKGGWYDAPGSVSSGSQVTGNHEITFERYLNNEKDSCIFGIKYDNSPFTYLNVGNAYSDLLTNVWVESNNTSGSIKVKEYKEISDKAAPTLNLEYANDYYVGDSINLKNGAKITDDSAYASILVPSFKVYDEKNNECEVKNGIFTPDAVGKYKIVASVNDLAMNEASQETFIDIKKANENETNIDVSKTSAVSMDESGIILYATAKKNNQDIKIKSIKAYDENKKDVTSTTIFKYTSKDGSLSYDYFKATEGNYNIVFEAEDGTTKNKEINVSNKNTSVYGFTYYDLSTLIYRNKFIVGDGTIIYLDNTKDDKQTVKLGMSFKCKYNWTFEYDVTDIKYTAQGKFFITKNTINQEGTSVGWEDLAIGGNVKANGDPDLWGYECNVLGTGWTSYQWRSVWQNPTTEFMPDPNDHTKGCGREASSYDQYGVGTHHYKITCSMDNNGKVTYTYYIDNEIEVIHHTSEEHDNANGVDFIQFSGEHFNGIVSNIKIY